MIYLIDGHNLIGKMPDIKLSDPDDEEKLVRRLESWVALDGRRRIRLFFDSGEFGGLGDLLSRPLIRVQFSRIGKTADSDIIRFMEGVKNSQEFTLVSSDREIIYAARKKRIGYILSEEFVLLLEEETARVKDDGSKAETAEAGAETEVDVTDSEVKEWMQAFENAPHKEPDIHIVKLPPREDKNKFTNESAEVVEEKKKKAALSPEQLKEGSAALTKEDLADWLELFGDETIREQKEKEKPVVLPDPAQERKKQATRRPKGAPVTRKFADGGLSNEEVDTWLEIFETEKKKK